MGKGAFVRIIDVPESILYGATTVVMVGTTLAMGTAVIGLAMTGIGLPVAIIPLAIGYGTYGATVYCGSKTGHKIAVACGSNKNCHSLKHAKKAMTGR